MPVLLERGHVLGIVADGEDAAVDARVQRLDPAVEHLGKAGDLGDVAHRQPGVRQAPCACRRWKSARRRDAARPRARSTRPVLSLTLSKARRIGRRESLVISH